MFIFQVLNLTALSFPDISELLLRKENFNKTRWVFLHSNAWANLKLVSSIF